jgi:hypothetical protein
MHMMRASILGSFLLPISLFLFGSPARQACAQNAGKLSPNSKTAYRLTMTECEDVDNCTTWSFLSSNGWKAYAKWRTGEEAILELESPSEGQIKVLRTDVQGSKAGLTATYSGTLRQGRLGGEFESHYQGHDESGNWYAIIGVAAQSPPSVIHLCIAHCFPIVSESGHYVNHGPQNTSIYTVESFTRDSFIMHRTDYGSFPLTATLTGQLSKDGNSVINGIILWTSGNSGSGAFQAAWGTAEHTVPWTDEERAAQGGGVKPSQITPADVYNGARALRDGVLELKKWNDFFQIFRSSDDQ